MGGKTSSGTSLKSRLGLTKARTSVRPALLFRQGNSPKDDLEKERAANVEKFGKEIADNIEVFRKKFEKRKQAGQEWNPDIVGVALQRWREQWNKRSSAERRNKNKLKTDPNAELEPINAEIKPMQDYRDPEELHNAMLKYPTKDELAKDLAQKNQALLDKGIKKLADDGQYKVFEASNPTAMSKLAQGSNWCTKNEGRAKEYLDNSSGKIQVIQKDGRPVAAISGNGTEVWFHTDHELHTGKNYSGFDIKPIMYTEDFNYINKTLKELGYKTISADSCTLFDTKDARDQYIQDTFNDDIESVLESTEQEEEYIGSFADSDEADRKMNEILKERQKIQVLLSVREEFEPEIEKKVRSNVNYGILHAAALNKRIKETEALIAEQLQNPEATKLSSFEEMQAESGDEYEEDRSAFRAFSYAAAINERFPEPHRDLAEKAIARLSNNVGDYVAEAGKGKRIPVIERELFEKNDEHGIVSYISSVKEPMPDLEDRIIEMEKKERELLERLKNGTLDEEDPSDIIEREPLLKYAISSTAAGKRASPKVEAELMKYPPHLAKYVNRVGLALPPEWKDIILSSPFAAVEMTKSGERLSKEFEDVIFKNAYATVDYVNVSGQHTLESDSVFARVLRGEDENNYGTNVVKNYLAQLKKGERVSRDLEQAMIESYVGEVMFEHSRYRDTLLGRYFKHLGSPIPELEKEFAKQITEKYEATQRDSAWAPAHVLLSYIDSAYPKGQRVSKELEDVFKRNPIDLLRYVVDVVQAPVPELRPHLEQDKNAVREYDSTFEEDY